MDTDNETINAEISAMRSDGYVISDIEVIDYGMSARVTAIKNGISRVAVIGHLYGYRKDTSNGRTA